LFPACFGQKSSTPLPADGGGGQPLSPVLIYRADSHCAQVIEAFLHPPFTMSFKCTVRELAGDATSNGVAPELAIRCTHSSHFHRHHAALFRHRISDRFGRAFANNASSKFPRGHKKSVSAREKGERTSLPLSGEGAPGARQAVFLFRQYHDGPSRSFVASEQLRQHPPNLPPSRPARNQFVAWRFPSVWFPSCREAGVSTSPAASTARPDRPSVALDDAVHSGDAIGKASADRCRIRAEQHKHPKHEPGCCGAPEYRHRCSAATANRKIIVRPESKIFSAISFAFSATDGAFDHFDHAVQKRFAGIGRDAHLYSSESTRVPPVTDERSPPDSSDHRRRFSRDRRFVHRGHAFDHFAVTGNEFAGGMTTTSPNSKFRSRNFLDCAVRF